MLGKMIRLRFLPVNHPFAALGLNAFMKEQMSELMRDFNPLGSRIESLVHRNDITSRRKGMRVCTTPAANVMDLDAVRLAQQMQIDLFGLVDAVMLKQQVHATLEPCLRFADFFQKGVKHQGPPK
ncbi:hypothetical protein EMIT07CA2_30149 [Brevibacillus sp. IT-7CA2]